MLERRLELQPGGCDNQPECGIGKRHPLNVDKCQQQRAGCREALLAAKHDAGD
ncbi:hypothetical protein D3C75_1343690 [compost metagenome]